MVGAVFKWGWIALFENKGEVHKFWLGENKEQRGTGNIWKKGLHSNYITFVEYYFTWCLLVLFYYQSPKTGKLIKGNLVGKGVQKFKKWKYPQNQYLKQILI